MDPLVITALISGISAIGALFAAVQARKKVEAEVDSVIVESAEKAVQLGLRQLEYLEKEVGRLRGQLAEERDKSQHMDVLVSEVRALKTQVQALKDELARRPTKEDLQEELKRLREQLTGLGETPVS